MQEEAGTTLSDTDPTTTQPTSRRGVALLLWTLAAAVVVADQGTKIWALAALTPGEPVNLIGSWIRLNLIRNSGAAFSLGDGVTWLLTIISILVLIAIVRMSRKVDTKVWATALGLILGGAVGNLIDRILREPSPGRGHVVDFIDYFGLFIGNVADIAIVGAALLIVWLSMRGIPLSGPAHGRHVAGHTNTDENGQS